MQTTSGRRRIVVGLLVGALGAGAPSLRAQSHAGGRVASAAQALDPSAVERELATVTQRVEHLGEESRQLAQEEQGIGPRRDELLQRARREVRMLYHLTQGQALALQGGPELLLDHAARTDRVRRTLHATLGELDAVTRRAATVGTDRARVGATLADAQARRGALESQRTQLQALAALQLPVTNAGLAEPGTAAQPAAPGVTLYGGAVAATASEAPTFGDAIGRLPLPLAGRVEVHRAQREGAEGPGVEFAVGLGSPVRAVYAGRVAFADRYGPYGRIVILDHGDHYYTVSANLGSMNVHVGDEVSTGTVLGTVGDDGRGPLLYFEVRHGSETVDPGPWFGL